MLVSYLFVTFPICWGCQFVNVSLLHRSDRGGSIYQVPSYIMLGISKQVEAPPTPQRPLSPMGDACSRMDLTAIHEILVKMHYRDDEGTNEVLTCTRGLISPCTFLVLWYKVYAVVVWFSCLSKSGPNRWKRCRMQENVGTLPFVTRILELPLITILRYGFMELLSKNIPRYAGKGPWDV